MDVTKFVKVFVAFVLICGACYAQDVWKPAFSLDHNDRTSNPLQPRPKETWVIGRNAGDSRWNHRGPMYPAVSHRSKSHQKHVAVGKTIATRCTIDTDLVLDEHGAWNQFQQIHGKNGPEDAQVGQISYSLRYDDKPNAYPDGMFWFLNVHGDDKTDTTGGHWANKRYAAITFNREQLPITWYTRIQVGGDGVTPAEDGTVYPIGKVSFFYQTAQMIAPVEVWYVEGPNYFPFRGYPDAGIQLPTFGPYVSKHLINKAQRHTYSNIAVAYEDAFTRQPYFDFGDVPGKPSDPVK